MNRVEFVVTGADHKTNYYEEICLLKTQKILNLVFTEPPLCAKFDHVVARRQRRSEVIVDPIT